MVRCTKLGGGNSNYHPNIFECKWSDHLLNDISWLRADTFSWHSGDVYTTAYNELLKEFNNATTTSGGGIQYVTSPNGYKIADATQEQAIFDKFNQDGIAWFYILDSTNRRFKLPRMKYKYWKDRSILPVVGNGMSLGLTNGNSNAGLFMSQSAGLNCNLVSYGISVPSQASSGSTSFATNNIVSVTSDPAKSGIEADISNAINQLPMRLYFYVGEYTRDAIEQTAGITAETLNNYVFKAGDTMTGQLNIVKASFNFSATGENLDLIQTPTARTNGGGYVFYDKNGKNTAIIQNYKNENGINGLQIITRKPDDSGWGGSFDIGTTADGKPYYSRPQIISTYTSGASGYNIWSNGYCEQWGYASGKPVTVSFLKKFVNTTYNLLCSPHYNGTPTGDAIYGCFGYNKTVSGFESTMATSVGIDWLACGYLAAGQY